MDAIIVGGGRVGRSLADRLADREATVTVVEFDQATAERIREAGHAVHRGDGTDTGVLRAAGIETTGVVAAVTGDDDTNLLVAQLARATFGIDRIVARVNEPTNVDAFEELDVEAIPATESVAWAIDNFVERPAIADWVTKLDEGGDVQEIEVTDETLVGKSIGDLDAHLPEGVIIALVTRDDRSQLPPRGFSLRYGDHVTFLGRRDGVRNALDHVRGDGPGRTADEN